MYHVCVSLDVNTRNSSYSKKNKMVIIWDYKSTVQTTPYPSATTCRAGVYSAAGMTMAASLVLIDVYTVIHFCCYTNQPKSNHNIESLFLGTKINIV